MLRSLQVRNFAIVDEVEIDFRPHMTVLTGETGAGKSILVDALGLVLGERGGSGLVRSGAKRAEFVAEFDLDGVEMAKHWLEEQSLDLDGDCHLRRVIGADGRSRAFINGNNVPLQSLKALGELLLDIHGQHFHQSLGRREVQRNLLDFFGGLADVAAKTRSAWADWQDLLSSLADLRDAERDRGERLELLRFQIDELDALGASAGELDALLTERAKLANSERIATGITAALERLYDADDYSAQAQLADALRSLDDLSRFDDSLEPAAQMLREAGILVGEAADLLRRYGDALEMDPARLQWVEERLEALHDVARKHRVEPEALESLHADLRQQLADLEHAEERGAELETKVAAADSEFRRLAAKLAAGRATAAKSLASDVTRTMADLGMPGGRFEVAVIPRDDPRAWGTEDIEFLISANPGQDPMPLAKIASGGELSRMSLAIQVIASDGSAIPTMVFDEVDAGVGGGVAEMVGRRLHDLGRTRQVLCVTHLPQVASLADQHFRIVKMSDGKTTRTVVNALRDDERTEEVARMLGGMEITRRTREHAAEMLAKGRRSKKKRA